MGVVQDLQKKVKVLEYQKDALKRIRALKEEEKQLLSVKLDNCMLFVAVLLEKLGGQAEISTEELKQAREMIVWFNSESEAGKLDMRLGKKQESGAGENAGEESDVVVTDLERTEE